MTVSGDFLKDPTFKMKIVCNLKGHIYLKFLVNGFLNSCIITSSCNCYNGQQFPGNLCLYTQTSIRSRYKCCCLCLRWFLLHGVHPQRPLPHLCEMWVSVGCHFLLQSHSSLLLLRQIDPLEPETDLQSLGSTSWLFEPRDSSRPSSSTKYETTIFWSRARPLSNPACCPISTPHP